MGPPSYLYSETEIPKCADRWVPQLEQSRKPINNMSPRLDLNVRFAREEDVDWCKHTLSIESEEFTRIKVGLNQLIVAETNGELIGILELGYIWEGHTYSAPFISGIIVLEAHRRQGVGRSFLSFLESYLREKGFKFLLSSCEQDELPPQEWHKHVGFEECGELTRDPSSPSGEVFFRKAL